MWQTKSWALSTWGVVIYSLSETNSYRPWKWAIPAPKRKENESSSDRSIHFQVRFDVSFRENSRFNGFFLPGRTDSTGFSTPQKRRNAGIVVELRFRAWSGTGHPRCQRSGHADLLLASLGNGRGFFATIETRTLKRLVYSELGGGFSSSPTRIVQFDDFFPMETTNQCWMMQYTWGWIPCL